MTSAEVFHDGELTTERGGARRGIPFLTASFATDWLVFLVLWPLWWWLGIEQFLPPVFVAWEMVRFVRSRKPLILEPAAVLAILLALWWPVPVFWITSGALDNLLRDTATMWAMALSLLLFASAARTRQEWGQLRTGLGIYAAYMTAGGVAYATGLWRTSIRSVLSFVLPRPLMRGLVGDMLLILLRNWGVDKSPYRDLPFRLSSFSQYPSGFSLVCVLLIPFAAWRAQVSRRWMRWANVVMTVGLVICLAGTGSRTAYVAFAGQVILWVVFRLGLHRRPKQLAISAVVAVLVPALIVVFALGVPRLMTLAQAAIVQFRPGSFIVRSSILTGTLRLLPQHLIAGWGRPVPIPGQGDNFSAGTHNSYLGMLFQHGLVGLALYLGILVVVWRLIVRGLWRAPAKHSTFWAMAALAVVGFNVREAFSIWWADMSICVALWTVWGLVLCHGRVFDPVKPRHGANRINILGVSLQVCSKDELLDWIDRWARERRRSLVLSGNAHSLNLAHQQPWLRELMEKADVVRVDGVGLQLAGAVLGEWVPPRATWADWGWELAERCAREELSLFFLGAAPGVADEVAARMVQRFPSLRIVGVHHGLFDHSVGSPGNEAVIQEINRARPDVLVVGLGMPLQERWLADNWERVDATVGLTCGGMFDYLSGRARRAPRWMTDHGLEWLGRLLIEPRRLWRRYLLGNPLFLWRLLLQRVGLLRRRAPGEPGVSPERP